MQIISSAIAVNVENFASKKQIFYKSAFKLVRNLAHFYAALCDLRVIEAERARYVKRKILQNFNNFLWRRTTSTLYNRSADLIVKRTRKQFARIPASALFCGYARLDILRFDVGKKFKRQRNILLVRNV